MEQIEKNYPFELCINSGFRHQLEDYQKQVLGAHSSSGFFLKAKRESKPTVQFSPSEHLASFESSRMNASLSVKRNLSESFESVVMETIAGAEAEAEAKAEAEAHRRKRNRQKKKQVLLNSLLKTVIILMLSSPAYRSLYRNLPQLYFSRLYLCIFRYQE